MTTPSTYSAAIARLLGLEDYQTFLAELPDEIACGMLLETTQETIMRNTYVALLAGATLEGVIEEIHKAVKLAIYLATQIAANVPAEVTA